jgi:hypothetical protein
MWSTVRILTGIGKWPVKSLDWNLMKSPNRLQSGMSKASKTED